MRKLKPPAYPLYVKKGILTFRTKLKNVVSPLASGRAPEILSVYKNTRYSPLT